MLGKGKIESGIGYVKRNALQGRMFASLEEENRHLLDWETTVADQRIHGTIRQQVGPFGHVLVTGMDWGGPNRAWEQESMQRLAEEVMPLVSRFRSSHDFAAPSFANFGIEGH